jgi:hypothetical protein
MRARIFSAVVALSMLLAACEDEGNPGDDSLLSGASLIIVLVIVGIIVAVMLSRRGRRP